MKKTFLLFVLTGAMLSLKAQGTIPDTIYGRNYQYYYHNWYDECDEYHNCPVVMPDRNWFYVNHMSNSIDTIGDMYDMVARRYIAPGRLAIRGLVALATGQVKPEYMMVFQHDTTAPGNTAFIDMVRWDTASRKVLKLPQCEETMHLGDSSKFLYLDAYEAYLKSPVVVDSVFYIAGTFNSDSLRTYSFTDGTYYVHNTYYECIKSYDYLNCDSCMSDQYIGFNFFPVTREWNTNILNHSFFCGMFLIIVDSNYYELTVLSDSVPMGTVEGGGNYVSMSQVQISATPAEGYRFAMWNDSVTDNPRTVEIYHDTVFTAIFTDEGNYVVSVASDPRTKGLVDGGGIYPPGQTATLHARATDSLYRFVGWADGDTANPRMVVVDRDTLFTARFAPVVGIDDAGTRKMDFLLSPNPTHDHLTVTVPQEDIYCVTVFDNNGRKMTSAVFRGETWTLDVNGLSAGTYFVSLRTKDGEGVKAFVKQ